MLQIIIEMSMIFVLNLFQLLFGMLIDNKTHRYFSAVFSLVFNFGGVTIVPVQIRFFMKLHFSNIKFIISR